MPNQTPITPKPNAYVFWSNRYEPDAKYHICQLTDLEQLYQFTQTNHELRELALYELFNRKGYLAQKYQSTWLRAQIKIYDQNHHSPQLITKHTSHQRLLNAIARRCQADLELTILWTGWRWRINGHLDPYELRVLIARIETIHHLSDLIYILMPFMEPSSALILTQFINTSFHPQAEQFIERIAQHQGRRFSQTASALLDSPTNRSADRTQALSHLLVKLYNNTHLNTYYHQLEQLLYHSRPEFCILTIQALRHLNSGLFKRHFEDKLINFMLQHPSPQIREQCCHTMAQHLNLNWQPYIRQALKDSVATVRHAAFTIWGLLIDRYPDKVVSTPLRDGLNHFDHCTREHCARQFINLPMTKEDLYQLQYVMLHDQNQQVRISAGQALYTGLGQRHNTSMSEALVAFYSLLKTGEAPLGLKYIACQALMQYDTFPNLETNWAFIQEQILECKQSCFEMLSELPHPQKVTYGAWLLNDSKPAIRLLACELISELPPDRLTTKAWQTISRRLHDETNHDVYQYLIGIMASKFRTITDGDRDLLRLIIPHYANGSLVNMRAVQTLHQANLAQPSRFDFDLLHQIVRDSTHYNHNTSYHAGYALSHVHWPVPSKYRDQQLYRAFKHGDHIGRKGIITGLSHRDELNSTMIKLLEQGLNDTDTAVAIEAYYALTSFYPTYRPDYCQRQLAQHVTNSRNNPNRRCHVLRALENTAQHGQPIYVQHVVRQALADTHKEIRKHACHALSALKHQLTTEDGQVLRAQLAVESSKRIKCQMCVTLGDIEQHQPETQNRLLLRQLLKDNDSEIQLAACIALARQNILNPSDIKAMRDLLASTNEAERNDLRQIIISERLHENEELPQSLLKDLNQQNIQRLSHEIGFNLEPYFHQIQQYFSHISNQQAHTPPNLNANPTLGYGHKTTI